ncbi:hypothetical protein ACXO8N_03655 [Lactobacillus delbrueckii subsp. bulgaricus]
MRKPMLAGILAAELALVGVAVFYHQSQADKSSQCAGSSKTYKVYSKASVRWQQQDLQGLQQGGKGQGRQGRRKV